MHWYGILQGFLLAITSIFILWVQGVVGLPLATPDLESLPIVMAEDVPVERAPRQVKPDPSTFDIFKEDRSSNNQIQQKSDGFRVFGKKLQDNYHRRTGYNETNAPPITVTRGSTTAPKKIHKSGIRLFASPQDPPPPEAAAPADGAPAAAGGAGGGAGGGIGGAPPKELTVSVQPFVTNQYGEKEYNAWGVTFGKHFFDTRFVAARHEMPRMTVNPKPPRYYYPKMENLTTVCLNRSTIYNEIKVEKWLMRHVYSIKKKVRPFFFSLRQQLYEKGDSEQCHNESYTDWLEYQECAIRRNQRMEYFIPKYPQHQLAIN
ncbi:uncharacterized protein LOC117136617 [Drosophila mauritiana]|uniref:Uncharacterized protein LOC117136617 n=1 Tax=Drosophila mauritiana TaxID=7226 RepID=A0A6P8JD77_DROMA|nr:uncharacterized protein LOC117136617 [Drosophila mauritiana]